MKKSVRLVTLFVVFVLTFFQFGFAQSGSNQGPNQGSNQGSNSGKHLGFGKPKLISGKALKLGAVYRFDEIIPNVYALLSIDSLVNGASVDEIDDNSNGVGYTDALQPRVNVPGLLRSLSHEAYAVFKMSFYNSGDNSSVNMQTVSATSLDIDGNATLKEFDEIDMGGGTATYMSTTPDISVISLLSGLKYRADDVLGIERNGIDTSAFANMFTVSKSNVSSFKIKLGGTSLQTSSVVRQYSVYMQAFQYPNQITLPVKLLDFTANYNKPNALLNWSTAQEHNFNYFMIERSTDGQNFSQVALVFGAGESDRKIDYSYNDKDLKGRGGVLYYRLKQVDIDGSFTYSSVRLIRLGDEKTSITLTTFPNPVATDLRITLPTSWQSKHIQIDLYNVSGQRVNAQDIANSSQTESISVASLQRGIYFVEVRNGNEIAKQRIVKN